jgi:hypothetical protein
MFFTVINKCTDLKKIDYELKKTNKQTNKQTNQKTCSEEKLLR